jgi:hypothetical protein
MQYTNAHAYGLQPCTREYIGIIIEDPLPTRYHHTFFCMSLLEKLVTAAGVDNPSSFVYGKYGNILDRFMTLGTCGPCVELGDHIALCMEFYFLNGVSSNVSGSSLVTWVPKDRVSIILIALGNCCTAVCICATKEIYYATGTISLPPGVPAGTMLLAHYTEDLKGMHREPRVLVYDVLCWGAKPDMMDIDESASRYEYRNMQYVNAGDRYRMLREDFDTLLKTENLRVLLTAHPDAPPHSSTIVLQWVGFVGAASQFLNGGIDVGHAVSSLLQMSDIDAVHPILLDCSQ